MTQIDPAVLEMLKGIDADTFKTAMDIAAAKLSSERTDKQQLKAADGGPLSDFHRYGKPTDAPTVCVKVKETGAEMVINSEDFDEKLHTKADPTPPTARRSLQAKTPFGTETADELRKMKADRLREMPEFELVEGSPKTKEEIVTAILAVRARGAA